MTIDRLFLLLAALFAATGVALGAFGAHALAGTLTEAQLGVYRTAVSYHLWHALGIGMTGLAVRLYGDSRPLKIAGWLMSAGILLFSGSLYLLTLTGYRWLGAITPLGGTAFIAAWLALGWFAIQPESRRN